MTRPRLAIAVVAAFLAAATVAPAADVGRLRHVASIYVDAKGVGMRQPEGVACNDRSTVIVADTGRSRLLRYSVVDRTAEPKAEIQVPQLTSPIRLQLNSKDEIFALDGKQRRIARLDPAGAFKGYLTPENVPPPSAVVPRSFKIDRSDHVYLLDVFSARVLVVDGDGKYQRAVPFPADYGFFSDLAVDGRGTIYLLDSVRGIVHAAAKDATAFTPLTKPLRDTVSFATSMAVDPRGVLYLADQNGAGIVVVGQDGGVLNRQLAMGWSDGLLHEPAQLCLNDKGQLFIADRGNSRIQVFSIAR
jgi:sugar lactone lactonase YvrE